MSPQLTARILRYGVVGITSTVVYFVLVAVLVEVFDQDPVLSAVVATSVIITMAYLLNHRWVFASARSHTSAFPSFLMATLISMTLNTGIMYLTVHIQGWWYGIGLVLATMIVPPTNFLLNYFWCFCAPGTSQ